MAAFSSTAFDTNAFSVNAFDFGTTPAPTPVDTHDGFDGNKKHREEGERKERLREFIARAVDPEAFVEPAIAELVAPAVQRMESGAVEIDWARLEAGAIARIEAILAAERQRELDEDEEDIEILLLH